MYKISDKSKIMDLKQRNNETYVLVPYHGTDGYVAVMKEVEHKYFEILIATNNATKARLGSGIDKNTLAELRKDPAFKDLVSIYITSKVESGMITSEYIMSCFAKVISGEMPAQRVPALKTAMELIQPKGKASKEVKEINRKSQADWGEPEVAEEENA